MDLIKIHNGIKGMNLPWWIKWDKSKGKYVLNKRKPNDDIT